MTHKISQPTKAFISENSKHACQDKFIRLNYPDFYEFLNNKYNFLTTISEKLYWYFNQINHAPVCEMCGKPTKYVNFNKGYKKFCSRECSESSPERIKRTLSTVKTKYEVSNISQIPGVNKKVKDTHLKKYGGIGFASKELAEKTAQTNLERYGDIIPMRTDNIKKKVQQTNLERYGVNWAGASEQIQQKIQQTNLERYGSVHPNPKIFDNYINSIKNKITNKYPNVIDIQMLDGNTIYTIKCSNPSCDKCTNKQYNINSEVYFHRIYNGIETCTRLLPVSPNISSIEIFIRDILDEYDINYRCNVKDIIAGEIDIYIPSHKLAIECNGCYWHSTELKNSSYHINKFKQCRDKNIQLLTIWEDQVKIHSEIIKSILLSKLGIYKNRIYARNCEILEVDSKTKTEFLNNNHIQGTCPAKVSLGIFKDKECVGIMTFNKRSQLSGNTGNSKTDWELTRFCTKLNTQVVGAAGKLMSYFINVYNPKSITSFSSNDISNGGLYKSLGFSSDRKITGAYWYINKNDLHRYHRTSFTKRKLEQMGYDIEHNTESQIMTSLPYWKIYDSGHIKWYKELL